MDEKVIECPFKEICMDFERVTKVLEVTKKKWLGVQVMRQKTGFPESTLRRTVKRLVALGLLHKKRIVVTGRIRFGRGSGTWLYVYKNYNMWRE